MGAFGSGREDYKEMTPAARSGADMADRRPILTGPNQDTFKSEKGEFFFIGRKVSEQEYNQLMDKYEALVQHEIDAKREELGRAA